MSKVLLLGAGGMLGFAMHSVLSSDEDIDVVWTNRTKDLGGSTFEWGQDDIGALISTVKPDYVVNCIGMIPQKLGKNATAETYGVNYALPWEIAKACDRSGAIAVEIATDCVFSGPKGPHHENSMTSCHDEYSKSKFAGEVTSRAVSTLRCSIIGARRDDTTSLLGWFLSQPDQAVIRGFTNHLWNGVTTLAYANIVRGMLRSSEHLPTNRTLHVVPSDAVSKYELLNLFRESFNRPDVSVEPHETEEVVDRRLATLWPQANSDLWAQAGYVDVPSISHLIWEMSDWFHTLDLN